MVSWQQCSTSGCQTGMRNMLRSLAPFVAAFTVLSAVATTVARAQTGRVYTNGRWFDGTTFRSGERFVMNGRFVARRPIRVDSVVDLHNSFVVPPFSETHSHNVESTRFDAVVRMYLERGIFYVKNPNSLPRFTTPLLGRVNGPGLLDVVFANGGLTATGGHPTAIAARQIARGSWLASEGDGGFFWNIDRIADLDEKWPRILAARPDFIKTYLLHSEEYAKRRADTAYLDWRGLDPSLLPEIVRRAHRARLQVSTHVETAYDFRQAVAAGVDEINHLPGFRPDRNDPHDYEHVEKYALTVEDVTRAARARVTVVTTIGAIVEILRAVPPNDPGAAAAGRALAMLRENLRLLHHAGVRIAIGSDEYTRTTDFEVSQLAALGAVDSVTVFKWWVENSAASIFPTRKLGRLATDYEASFLVFATNPIQHLGDHAGLVMRVKQGVVLEDPRE